MAPSCVFFCTPISYPSQCRHPDFIHTFHSFIIRDSACHGGRTSPKFYVLSFTNLDETSDAAMNTESATCAGLGCCMHSFAAGSAAGLPQAGPAAAAGALGSSGNSSATSSPPQTPMAPPTPSMFREMPSTYLQVSSKWWCHVFLDVLQKGRSEALEYYLGVYQ